MSQVSFVVPVEEMTGQFAKGSNIIMRRKKYRRENGSVFKVGVQESYKIVNPRDYAKNPPKGKELANIQLFKDSKQRTVEILHADKLSDEELKALTQEERMRIKELRAQLEDFRKRFYAQLKKPDPEAPYEKKMQPGKFKLMQKQYTKLDNFIQAIIRERMMKQQNN